MWPINVANKGAANQKANTKKVTIKEAPNHLYIITQTQ
jgi:hypothetical protein